MSGISTMPCHRSHINLPYQKQQHHLSFVFTMEPLERHVTQHWTAVACPTEAVWAAEQFVDSGISCSLVLKPFRSLGRIPRQALVDCLSNLVSE